MGSDVEWGMAKPRKSKIKPFSWADLGLSKAEGEALEAAGCTPMRAAKIVAVPIPNLPEYLLPREEDGSPKRAAFGGYRLSRCFVGAPDDAAERLIAGELPGELIELPHKAAEALAGIFHGLQPWHYDKPDDRRAPEWERAMVALGLPSGRPSWTGTIAGAFQRGFLTPTVAALMGEGHSLDALKTLERSNEDARLIVMGATSNAATIVATAQKAAEAMKQEAEKVLQGAKRQAALDLTEATFGRDDAWQELLEDQVLRASRFRFTMQVGTDRCRVEVDRAGDVIEVVRNRDAASWQLTEDQLDDADPNDPAFGGIVDPLREALAKFNRYATEDVHDVDDPELVHMLLQHRARSALELLKAPTQGQGLQLALEL